MIGHGMGEELLSVPFRWMVWWGCGLPAGAFLSCLFLALNLHFEAATRTHCGVPNFLPSISAIVGSYQPEMFIWRLCIALHCLPRFALAFVYRNFYLTSPTGLKQGGGFRAAAGILAGAHVAEVGGLLVLSMCGSVENHTVHKGAFCVFIAASIVYQALSLRLFDVSGRRAASTSGEKSYQSKWLYALLNIAAILAALFFYAQHNAYCQEGVYSLFALAEYVVVASNIAFHATAGYDFQGRRFVLTDSGHGYAPLTSVALHPVNVAEKSL